METKNLLFNSDMNGRNLHFSEFINEGEKSVLLARKGKLNEMFFVDKHFERSSYCNV